MAEQISNEIDLSPEARLGRIQDVMARMAAGEIIDTSQINPQTHSPELIALVGQNLRRGGGIEL